MLLDYFVNTSTLFSRSTKVKSSSLVCFCSILFLNVSVLLCYFRVFRITSEPCFLLRVLKHQQSVTQTVYLVCNDVSTLRRRDGRSKLCLRVVTLPGWRGERDDQPPVIPSLFNDSCGSKLVKFISKCFLLRKFWLITWNKVIYCLFWWDIAKNKQICFC